MTHVRKTLPEVTIAAGAAVDAEVARAGLGATGKVQALPAGVA